MLIGGLINVYIPAITLLYNHSMAISTTLFIRGIIIATLQYDITRGDIGIGVIVQCMLLTTHGGTIQIIGDGTAVVMVIPAIVIPV
jgi:hypothetical protein